MYMYDICLKVVGWKPFMEDLMRRKVRLIKGNAKCRHLTNLPGKGFCGRCLSVRGPEPPPPLSHCIRVYSVRSTRLHSSVPLLEPGTPRLLVVYKKTNKPLASRN
jgi:hypothetical protein